ncbi:DUF805 domain-containing protein [Jatrophihabitans telluris]|uniref:DUF805 domain-containing protein n=1 Tax=Jatrophihabitans telluris TaxID=2038343 RepID=A0ABY4QXA2_9ACTN|nr:DUF805 domain-containing protein [Jatrophihabitans telluris]UQX87887.1 DUF805 domain-containing protein [Jatrophihabitans telluris]
MGSNSNHSGAITLVIALLAIYVAVVVVLIWAYVRIIRRAGYSGWWILAGLVPLLNVIMMLLFAFKEWPIQRELAYLRQQVRGYPPNAQGHPPYGAGGYGYGYGSGPGTPG